MHTYTPCTQQLLIHCSFLLEMSMSWLCKIVQLARSLLCSLITAVIMKHVNTYSLLLLCRCCCWLWVLSYHGWPQITAPTHHCLPWHCSSNAKLSSPTLSSPFSILAWLIFPFIQLKIKAPPSHITNRQPVFQQLPQIFTAQFGSSLLHGLYLDCRQISSRCAN